MTKAELIRKIAKRSGIPDQEAKFFFELFLKKASLQLRPGETIKLNGLGYFQLKTGKIRKVNASDGVEEDILSDFMVFYPLNSETSENDNLIFNVPVLEDTKYNFIDSYFSLSFGKPVIPLKNASSSEYFLPPTGMELRRLAESRSEKLLQDVEIVDMHFKGDETLTFEKDAVSDSQIEIDWENIQTKIDENNKSFKNIDEDNILSWDFSSDIDKELEEEAILDTSHDDSLIQNYEELKDEDITWNFGETHIEIIPEEVAVLDIPLSEEKQEHIFANRNFEEVKSLTSELHILDDDSSWDFGGEEILKQTITEELNDKGFAEIKNSQTKYPFETDISEYNEEEIDLIQQNKFPEDENFPEIEELVEDTYEPFFPLEPPVVKKADVIRESITMEINKTIEDELNEPPVALKRSVGFKKRKGLGLFVISSVILLFSIGIIFYVKYITPRIPGTKIKYIPAVNQSAAVIVERSYEIPVRYPYNSSVKLSAPHDPYNLSTPSITPTVTIPDTVQKKPEIKPPVIQKEQIQTSPVLKKEQNKITTGTSEHVKDFIYKSGDKYFVQISSWPKSEMADKEAAVFKSKGFSTEIQKVQLPKGVWYRLRVGAFSSVEEAEKFYNNNR